MYSSLKSNLYFIVLGILLCVNLAACNTPIDTPADQPVAEENTSTPTVAPASTGPQAVTIHVDDAYKPYSYRENGEAKGMYVDVLRAVFDQMEDYTVTVEPIPWPRGKRMMEEGQGLGLAPAFFHGHDWPYLYPYSLPFYTETIIAVCDAETLSEPRPVWPDDYVGLRVGNVAGFGGWGGEAFYELVEAGDITYEEAPSSSTNILKLGVGRVDCVMMEDRAFDYEYQNLQDSGEYQSSYAQLIKGAVIGEDPVYIGYSKPALANGTYPFHADFRQTFDSILYQMLKSGEVAALMDMYEE